MKAILYPFLLLAAVGLALSIGANLMAVAGVAIPGSQLFWVLHVGIFVVWLPAVLVSAQMTRHTSRADFWKIALAGCPPWMRRAGYVLIGYAILNFILFIASAPGQLEQPGDEARPSMVRGFSGHWMIFYGAAFAILYSRIHAPRDVIERRCPRGHAASPTDRFCSECGYAFPDEGPRG